MASTLLLLMLTVPVEVDLAISWWRRLVTAETVVGALMLRLISFSVVLVAISSLVISPIMSPPAVVPTVPVSSVLSATPSLGVTVPHSTALVRVLKRSTKVTDGRPRWLPPYGDQNATYLVDGKVKVAPTLLRFVPVNGGQNVAQCAARLRF